VATSSSQRLVSGPRAEDGSNQEITTVVGRGQQGRNSHASKQYPGRLKMRGWSGLAGRRRRTVQGPNSESQWEALMRTTPELLPGAASRGQTSLPARPASWSTPPYLAGETWGGDHPSCTDRRSRVTRPHGERLHVGCGAWPAGHPSSPPLCHRPHRWGHDPQASVSPPAPQPLPLPSPNEGPPARALAAVSALRRAAGGSSAGPKSGRRQPITDPLPSTLKPRAPPGRPRSSLTAAGALNHRSIPLMCDALDNPNGRGRNPLMRYSGSRRPPARTALTGDRDCAGGSTCISALHREHRPTP
jgi:hypothetical protein